MAKVRTAARVDGNHAAIVRQFKAVGASVHDVHQVPNGFDILVGYRGLNFIFEIKDPAQPKSGRKLTAGETAFKDTWRGGEYHVIETFDEGLKIITTPPKTPKNFPTYGAPSTLNPRASAPNLQPYHGLPG
jgi:hypothetical protein